MLLTPCTYRPLTLAAALAARRVLIADPNADTVESTRMLLRLWGHDVRGVGTGRAVLEQVDDYRPDVILMEMALPGLNGCEVARQLRRQYGNWGPWLVALTGYGDAVNQRRCRAAGFDYHLLKPVEPEVLQRLLASSPVVAARGGAWEHHRVEYALGGRESCLPIT